MSLSIQVGGPAGGGGGGGGGVAADGCDGWGQSTCDKKYNFAEYDVAAQK